MESKLCPVCKSLFACKSDINAKNTILSQFISSIEVNYQTMLDFSKDDKFPCLCQHIMNSLCDNPIPLPSSGKMPEIVAVILKFLNDIMKGNPILLDTIAASTNLDTLIPQFFSNNVSKTDIIEPNISYLFQPIKFIAFVSTSKRVMLTSTPSSHLLIIVLTSLLTNPQLAAWAATCFSGLLRNSPSFFSILKAHPMYKCVKNKLSALLPSSDSCVVVAALSATVSLNSLGDDAYTAMRAALKYLIDDTVFPLSTKLCCWAIIDLISKSGNLTEEAINRILQLPINSSGLRAFELINLLIELIDMNYKFGSMDFIKQMFKKIIYYNENFVATAGCHFLAVAFERCPDLFIGIDENGHLFKRVIDQYFRMSSFNDPERLEALLTQIRILLQAMKAKRIPENIVNLLTSQEEAIFMDFMRHIESNDSYLSVCYFNFLLVCSRTIENWAFRIKRLLVDSQFPALLVHVLVSSKNRRVISDALVALQFFMNDCEIARDYSKTFFFNSAVSGFLVLNQQTSTQVSSLNCKLNQERHDFEINIQRLNIQIKQLEDDKVGLQKVIDDEKLNSTRIGESIAKLQDELKSKDNVNNKLVKKIKILKASFAEQNVNIKNLEDTNRNLQNEIANLKKVYKKYDNCKIELQRAYAENERSKERIKDLEAKLSYTQQLLSKSQGQIESLRSDLNEKEDQYASLQKRCQESQEINVSLQAADSNNKAEIQRLNELIESLKNSLKEENLKVDNLTSTIASLQDENIRLKALVDKANDSREKYKIKKQALLDKMKECEREKRKWESIAKFNNHVCTVKKVTVQDVFGDLINSDCQETKLEIQSK
ncbi:hypothetical protein M9Y10_013330 [Tritrichomonas musculus]|uniref:Uncharacterized protein n=1 Tax=Tritrichomonas musculus TaxID=1915356 RepID=A0ABR2I6R6_9EUKA